jgi:hypothetical protein
MECFMATNLQLLIDAGLILNTCQPNATDIAIINALSQSDVQGLINVFKGNGIDSPFLVRNCNPDGTVAPGEDSRTIGIVF